ncbi:MAG: UTP--glucose-1-phosphate uridylyltransferase [Coriobacteriaceae bacterium]|nr:UTP--glucose-1-phosphate uridylyltransferase [Coriobacteriaceae bacterium]
MKAVIPAAGLGTRFLPLTKAVPKEMLPILDKPAIQYVVEEALAAGVDEAIIVSRRDKDAIEQQFTPDDDLVSYLRGVGKDDFADAVEHAGSLPVTIAYQDEPLGLGHAVHCAASATGDDPFIVMLADVIVPDNAISQRMVQVSEAHDGASVIALLEVPEDEVSRFGIVGGDMLDDGTMHITTMVEKPALEDAPSRYAIFGRYLLTPKVMELLAGLKPGAGGEIQLTDALVALLDSEEVYGCIIDADEGFDTGTMDTWLATNITLALRDERYRDTVNDVIERNR